MVTLTASEARATLPDLLTRVEGGEEVVITRHGHPVAVVVRPDVLRTRRATPATANAERIQQLLTSAAATALPRKTGLTGKRAEELIAEIRAARAAR